MKDLKGKVAVVTGAASGIGLALATHAAREGMKVVLADIEPDAVEAAAKKLRAGGAETLAVVTDAAKRESVEALRDRTIEAFGKVHLLCNNAGVGVAGHTWEVTHDDWTWILGVNLWGVIHGIRTFVPAMIESGEEGHIVNTASMAGLIAGPGMSAYNATKHAVVAISESMYLEQVMIGSKVRTSVLCPGWVNTRIMDSQRNRPADLAEAAAVPPEAAAMEQIVRQFLAQGMPPAEVANRVFDAVAHERFWILTHDEMKPLVTERFAAAVKGENPALRSPV